MQSLFDSLVMSLGISGIVTSFLIWIAIPLAFHAEGASWKKAFLEMSPDVQAGLAIGTRFALPSVLFGLFMGWLIYSIIM